MLVLLSYTRSPPRRFPLPHQNTKALENLRSTRGTWTNDLTQEVNDVLSDLGIDVTILEERPERGGHGTTIDLGSGEVGHDLREAHFEKGTKLVTVAAKAVTTVREMLERALK